MLVGVGTAVFEGTGVSVELIDERVKLVGDGELAGFVATDVQAVMLITLQIKNIKVRNLRYLMFLVISPFFYT